MIQKNLITVISIIGLLAFLSPANANANEKSGLRLYHVKISKFDLKAKCMENFPTEELIQQSSSIYKKINYNGNQFILQYTSMGDCILNEYR